MAIAFGGSRSAAGWYLSLQVGQMFRVERRSENQSREDAAEKQEQIPHRLKPVRDDKNIGLATAPMKVRPFKTLGLGAYLQMAGSRLRLLALTAV
jgi:hypothetical protein